MSARFFCRDWKLRLVQSNINHTRDSLQLFYDSNFTFNLIRSVR